MGTIKSMDDDGGRGDGINYGKNTAVVKNCKICGHGFIYFGFNVG